MLAAVRDCRRKRVSEVYLSSRCGTAHRIVKECLGEGGGHNVSLFPLMYPGQDCNLYRDGNNAESSDSDP